MTDSLKSPSQLLSRLGRGRHFAMLTVTSLLLLVPSGCATHEVRPLFPSRADLAVEPEPVPGDDIVTDAKADERYRAEHEAWGRRGWASVARICRWANANGASFDCPKP